MALSKPSPPDGRGTYTSFVVHGSTAGTSRPTSTGPVTWQGSVTPTNAVAGDLWEDTTTDPYTVKIRGASAFTQLGGTSVASDPLSLVTFIVSNPGNNLSIVARATPGAYSTPVVPEGYTATGKQGRLHGMGIIQAAGAAGTISLFREVTDEVGPSVYLDSAEVLVMSLDGSQVAYGYPDSQVVDVPTTPDTVTAVPFTSDWVITGTDLSVSGGDLVTAAGGTFIVLVEGYVTALDPS